MRCAICEQPSECLTEVPVNGQTTLRCPICVAMFGDGGDDAIRVSEVAEGQRKSSLGYKLNSAAYMNLMVSPGEYIHAMRGKYDVC